MKETRFKTLPKKLRCLIVGLAAVALVILSWSCWDFATHTRSGDRIGLTILALLTVPFMIFLPSTETFVFIGEAYPMVIAIIHGTSTCVVASACYALGILLITARFGKSFRHVFNFSASLCEAFLYSMAYQLTKPTDSHGMTGRRTILLLASGIRLV